MKNQTQKKDLGYFLFEGKGKRIGTVIGCAVIAILVAFLAAGFVTIVFLNI
ncbi:MAG: hypothetical protein LBN27_00070 [Prevotellaceae bacterium]|jgi:hypothetical protein|nr:hypothetical protein [Prevotellaceae bacterium]